MAIMQATAERKTIAFAIQKMLCAIYAASLFPAVPSLMPLSSRIKSRECAAAPSCAPQPLSGTLDQARLACHGIAKLAEPLTSSAPRYRRRHVAAMQAGAGARSAALTPRQGSPHRERQGRHSADTISRGWTDGRPASRQSRRPP